MIEGRLRTYVPEPIWESARSSGEAFDAATGRGEVPRAGAARVYLYALSAYKGALYGLPSASDATRPLVAEEVKEIDAEGARILSICGPVPLEPGAGGPPGDDS
jgi:hypothetical protein